MIRRRPLTVLTSIVSETQMHPSMLSAFVPHNHVGPLGTRHGPQAPHEKCICVAPAIALSSARAQPCRDAADASSEFEVKTALELGELAQLCESWPVVFAVEGGEHAGEVAD